MRSLGAALIFLVVLGTDGAGAASLTPIGSFEQPTYVTSDPGNPDRLFVAGRLGKIDLVQGGSVSTFADLTSLVDCPTGGCDGERGLMSIALAPDFQQSGHLYVDYIDNPSGAIHVDELTARGDTASLASRRALLEIPHAEASNHNGGQLQFGPEGHLFISTGDGGGGNGQFHHAQDLGSLLGKILRIDPMPSDGLPYTVPPGNPFPATDTIWSYGLRNPFRFSFDRLSGDLVIGDVGQGAREEIDYAPSGPAGAGGAGANYGWNCREGLIAGPGDDLPPGECATRSFAEPVFDYPHADPGGGAAFGCAIIGGYVVRDTSLGELYGRYLYTDLCNGELRALRLPPAATGSASDDRSLGLSVPSPFSFGEDSCGRIYVVAGTGEVHRLEGDVPADCPLPTGQDEETPTSGGSEPGGSGRPPDAAFFAARARTRLLARATRGHGIPSERFLITLQASPCEGLSGQPAALNRGGHRLRTARLDATCSARFTVRVIHRSTFRGYFAGDGTYPPTRSRRLTIRTGPTGPFRGSGESSAGWRLYPVVAREKRQRRVDQRSRQAWALTRRQHWVVTRRQLLELGFSAAAIEHRLVRGRRPELVIHRRAMP